MEEVLKADIFFFITSVAVILLTLMVAVILYFVYKIVRSVQRIVGRIEEGSEHIREDIEEFRRSLSISNLLFFVQRFMPRSGGRRSSRNGKNDDSI